MTNSNVQVLGRLVHHVECVTTNMLEWVHTTYKDQNDLLCTCMHRNQNC
jgi:hypothetical protein